MNGSGYWVSIAAKTTTRDEQTDTCWWEYNTPRGLAKGVEPESDQVCGWAANCQEDRGIAQYHNKWHWECGIFSWANVLDSLIDNL